MDLCTRIIAAQLTRIVAAAFAAAGLGYLHVGLSFGPRLMGSFLILTAVAMIVPDRTGKA